MNLNLITYNTILFKFSIYKSVNSIFAFAKTCNFSCHYLKSMYFFFTFYVIFHKYWRPKENNVSIFCLQVSFFMSF